MNDKYDDLLNAVHEATHARASVLIVLDGDRGTGLAVAGSRIARLALADEMRAAAARVLATTRQMFLTVDPQAWPKEVAHDDQGE